MKKSVPANLRHWIVWAVEAGFVFILIGIIRLMPPAIASAVGGALVGQIGPLTPWHRRSLFNIGYAMPETSMAERQRIARAAWVNLGRVGGEFCHVRRIIASDRITIEGLEHLNANSRGGFMIGAHLGNWEIFSAPANRLDLKLSAVYRPTNNPIVTRLLYGRSSLYHRIYEKGPQGARAIASTITKGEYFAMLVDQKLREGMMLDFFGHKASTAIAHIRFALRSGVPIFMVQVIRTGGCRFHLRITPFDLPEGHGRGKDDDETVALIGTRINAIIERWIRENPEQWLWPHRRWPASKGEREVS